MRRLLEHVRSEGLSGYVLFGQDYIRYFTGFVFLSNERPVVFAESASGEDVVFVPEFEVERTRAETSFERVESYPEYPGIEHPMRIFARVLADLGIRDPIGADGDGYPGILGYQGPAAERGDFRPGRAALGRDRGHDAAQERARARADPRERPLVCARPPAPAGVLAGRRHRDRGEPPGRARGDARAVRRRSATTIGQMGSSDGVSAGYRGQIGLRSSWAHAVAHNIAFQPGDVLVTETSAPIWGYNAELERAMIIGAADRRDAAALRPHGRRAAGRDRRAPARRHVRRRRPGAVMRYLEDNGLLAYWRQHTGHGIGLRNHEAPVPRRRRPHAGRARDGVHDRAGALLGHDRRLPPLRHGCRHARRHRRAHRVSAGPREPDDPDLTRQHAAIVTAYARSPMKPVIWGIVSTAHINRLVIPGAHASPKVELRAVASRDRGARRGVRARVGDPASRTARTRSCSPTRRSRRSTSRCRTRCTASGRSRRSRRASTCSARSRSRGIPTRSRRRSTRPSGAGRFLSEAFMWRHNPQTARLVGARRRRARSASCGSCARCSATRSTTPTTSACGTDVEGGALMDVGCYCVSGVAAARRRAGVASSARRGSGRAGTDWVFAAMMRFPDDVLALFDCGTALPERDELEAIGSEGSLFLDDPWHCAQAGDRAAARRRGRADRARARRTPTGSSSRT